MAANTSVPVPATNQVYACSDAERARLIQLQRSYYQSVHYTKPAGLHEKMTEWWEHLDYVGDNGAIPFPGNGVNVKHAGRRERCLTCVRYNRPCGSTVTDRKCSTCPGHPRRRCRWLEPEKNVWTYPAHQRANGGTINRLNTREGKAEKARLQATAQAAAVKQRSASTEDEEEEDDDAEYEEEDLEADEDEEEEEEPDCFGLSDDEGQQALKKVAERMRTDGGFTDNAINNRELMAAKVEEGLAFLKAKDETAPEDESDAVYEVRVRAIRAFRRLASHIDQMRSTGSGMSAEKLIAIARW